MTLPPGLQPVMGTDWSPVGQIYFYTLKSTNPKFDVMALKSIEGWILEKQFESHETYPGPESPECAV